MKPRYWRPSARICAALANEHLNMGKGCPRCSCSFCACLSRGQFSDFVTYLSVLYAHALPADLGAGWRRPWASNTHATGGGAPHRPWLRSSVVSAADRRSASPWLKPFQRRGPSTPRGFEPLRAEPNEFLFHHLNHSVTVSSSAESFDVAPTRPHGSLPRYHPSLGSGRGRGGHDLGMHEGIIHAHTQIYIKCLWQCLCAIFRRST